MKGIAALLGAGLVGVFVGAALAEAIHRRPNLLKDIGKGTSRTFRVIADAFKEGYRGKPARKAG
jgi:hypothetical protein